MKESHSRPFAAIRVKKLYEASIPKPPLITFHFPLFTPCHGQRCHQEGAAAISAGAFCREVSRERGSLNEGELVEP